MSSERNGLDIPRRRQLLYAAMLTICGLAAIELACRLVVAATPNARWNHHASLVATVGFGGLNEILEPDPLRFWRLKPDVTRKKLSGRIGRSGPIDFTVSTDGNGYRRAPDAPRERLVLFLGDSCTFGVGVDDDETFPFLLQQRLSEVRSLNAGVPGYSAFQGRQLLEDRSFSTPPDVVVASFLFNDDSYWDDRGDLEIARMLATPSARLARYSRLVSLLSGLRPEAPRPVAEARKRPRLSDDEYADELRGIVDRCRELGCQTLLMVWPLRRQMADGSTLGKQAVMRDVAHETGMPLLDLVPAFRAKGGARLFADVVHANAAGNRLIADQLEPLLRQELGRRER